MSDQACTLYFNPGCSKCREAYALLEAEKPRIVEYLKAKPGEAELLALMDILIDEPRAMVRTKEPAYLASPFPLGDRAVIARELAKRPELLERPIVVKNGKAVVARPVSRIAELG